ncbi:hypothetical protein BB561_000011 [Smittium simulii]|uniref:Uncharacterized protein n=1 Tax=Smittium simulii TaxID=133385 RepID=A0A2T9Z0Z4_9FUNG|nr:hypothetical protein BB561_000011 [Smittium simulii]
MESLPLTVLNFHNNPLVRVFRVIGGTITTQLIVCAKGLCGVGLGLGTVGGSFIFLDEILKESGRTPIFMPKIGEHSNNLFNKLGYKIDNTQILNRNIQDLNGILNNLKPTDFSNGTQEDLLLLQKKILELTSGENK